MAGALTHNKVIVEFENESGKVASIGLAVSSGNPLSLQTGLQTWANNIGTYISASLDATLTDMMDAATSVTAVKCAYMIGTTQNTAALATLAAAKAGTGTTPHPAQVSAVFSFLTALTGKSFAGRAYWPATGAALNGSGEFTATLEDVAQGFAELVTTGILGAAGAPTGANLAVYSAKLDVATPVHTIRFGNVPDIQRRRRIRSEITAVAPI